jgi:hypothetical protein
VRLPSQPQSHEPPGNFVRTTLIPVISVF